MPDAALVLVNTWPAWEDASWIAVLLLEMTVTLYMYRSGYLLCPMHPRHSCGELRWSCMDLLPLSRSSKVWSCITCNKHHIQNSCDASSRHFTCKRSAHTAIHYLIAHETTHQRVPNHTPLGHQSPNTASSVPCPVSPPLPIVCPSLPLLIWDNSRSDHSPPGRDIPFLRLGTVQCSAQPDTANPHHGRMLWWHTQRSCHCSWPPAPLPPSDIGQLPRWTLGKSARHIVRRLSSCVPGKFVLITPHKGHTTLNIKTKTCPALLV